MSSLDVDSPLTNIPLEEIITICTESIYNQNDTVEGLSKSEFIFRYERTLFYFQ